jgi:hypothetical protein
MNKVQQAHVETLFYVWVWQKKIKCENCSWKYFNAWKSPKEE